MMNLLPPEAQKTVQLEYWGRVLTVWALLLMIVTLIAGLLLSPTYVLVEAQRSALSSDTNTKREANAELEKDVTATNGLARALTLPASESISYTDLINAIATTGGNTVALRGYRVVGGGDNNVQLQAQGTATSRTALLTFKETLEAMPEIASVDIPLSDLVRGTDVPFVATITLATP